MRWLVRILINAVLLLALAGYFDSIYLSSVWAALVASILLSFLNTFVRPLLILLTLPVTVLTFGLFLFVINAMTLAITASLMGSSFDIGGFSNALFVSLAISLFHLLIESVRKEK
ncbi:phage holin family protein [Anoxybacillus flavithermus]|uniref:Phage holin family protein n=1 Tax=Anoxybacillus flavithermus TaxID=33934 RepID=A0A2G5RSV6_9BACL|nr:MULTISPECIES: phage holin family protein [Anoxybacillus]KFZ42507.1 membrane protein [Anoxybacillus sp. KU2-6(11)]PIC05796.1 phage holin family protein [Anoxybacillus flavithermus]